jgi:hypothetical protein
VPLKGHKHSTAIQRMASKLASAGPLPRLEERSH